MLQKNLFYKFFLWAYILPVSFFTTEKSNTLAYIVNHISPTTSIGGSVFHEHLPFWCSYVPISLPIILLSGFLPKWNFFHLAWGHIAFGDDIFSHPGDTKLYATDTTFCMSYPRNCYYCKGDWLLGVIHRS